MSGTILLPNDTFSTLREDLGCPGGFGADKTFLVHFVNTDAAANFNGLDVSENLSSTQNECDFNTSFPLAWVIGSLSTGETVSNAIDDGNGKCGFGPTETCTSIIDQTFSIGNCTTPNVEITFTMVNGVGDVTRSDLSP